MATQLAKALKREIQVEDAPYIVQIDQDGLRLTGKGKRKPTVKLLWRDLVSGDAALATALNASLMQTPSASKPR